MASNRLTDIICRSAKYDSDGSKKLFDDGGLFLELMPTGSKKWRLKFRFNGKENRKSFGDYPLVSLAEARDKRDAAKKLLLEGIHLAQHRAESRRQQAIRSENLFSIIAEEWIGNKRDGWSVRFASRICGGMFLAKSGRVGSNGSHWLDVVVHSFLATGLIRQAPQGDR